MTSRTNTGVTMDMLENLKETRPSAESDLKEAGLQLLTHEGLLKSIQKVNGRMTRELLNSPDTFRVIDADDAPVPINPRRFCELMAPYLCMN